MIDVTHQISAVRRQVGRRVLDAGEARTVKRLSAEAEGRTRFEIEHIARVDDERWAQFGPGAVGVGWDMALMGLAIHLSSGRTVDRRESTAWTAGADGRQFVSLSSQRWCDASISAGLDEAAARAAADRTTAFYTPSPAAGSSGSSGSSGS